jgi:hypothetical protein
MRKKKRNTTMPHDHPVEYALLVVARWGFIKASLNSMAANSDVQFARGNGSQFRISLMEGVREQSLFSLAKAVFVMGIVAATLYLPPPPPSYAWNRQNLWTMLGLFVISSLLTIREIRNSRFRQRLGLGRTAEGTSQDSTEIAAAYDAAYQQSIHGNVEGDQTRKDCYSALSQIMARRISKYYDARPNLRGDPRSKRAVKESVDGLNEIFRKLDEYEIQPKAAPAAAEPTIVTPADVTPDPE